VNSRPALVLKAKQTLAAAVILHYFLALFEDSVSIFNLEDSRQIQTIPFPASSIGKSLSLQGADGQRVFVCTNKEVSFVEMIPYSEKVDALLARNLIKEAFECFN